MLDFTAYLGEDDQYNARNEETVHGCFFRYDIERILTPPGRIRLKKDDMLIEGLIALLVGGGKYWAAQARGSR